MCRGPSLKGDSRRLFHKVGIVADNSGGLVDPSSSGSRSRHAGNHADVQSSRELRHVGGWIVRVSFLENSVYS
jgi:hypothetical protein